MIKKKLLVIGLCFGLLSCSDNSLNLVAGPDVTAVTDTKQSKVNVKFKAGVIKGSGDVTPVARREFIIRKYDFHKFHADYLSTRNTANKPNFETDFKYNINLRNPDADIQFKNVLALFELNLKTWHNEVYSDFKNQLSKVSKDKPVAVKSDLSGDFDIDLESNTTYYISGSYEDTSNTITWSSLEFKTSDKKIELSNDNGKIRAVTENNPRKALTELHYEKLLLETFETVKDL